MIDLHCHLLPGVDEGAESVEQAVAGFLVGRASGRGLR